ncbi:MAG: hypothetical protein JWM47_3065, partial [Acidimicrobiales bacterium]|nr:hypothetical protein [Acidimicrobiales bacterium]
MIGSALAPTGPLHPGLFVLGLLAGAAGGLVARALGARHAPSRPATALLVASGLGAAVLVGDGLAP